MPHCPVRKLRARVRLACGRQALHWAKGNLLRVAGDVLGDAQRVYADFEVGVVERALIANVGEAYANKPVGKIGKRVPHLQMILVVAIRDGGSDLDGNEVPALH